MKAMKNVLLVVGLMLVAAGGVLLALLISAVRAVYDVATANPAAGNSPVPMILLTAGAALVGGLLVGLGIGLPRLTQNAVRAQALAARGSTSTTATPATATGVTDATTTRATDTTATRRAVDPDRTTIEPDTRL